MNPDLQISDSIFAQLQSQGEVRAIDSHGVTVVLMTLDARRKLSEGVYDDSEWQPAEMLAVAAQALADLEGWGAEGMDEYDQVYGHLFDDDAQDQ